MAGGRATRIRALLRRPAGTSGPVGEVVLVTAYRPCPIHDGEHLIVDCPGEDSARPDGLALTTLSAVTPASPRFAWAPRIPLGAITIVAGLPGQGKSTLTVELGARITRGQLDGDLHGQPGAVVVASAEDALRFVLVPRFTAAGADLDRVHTIALRRDGLDLGIELPADLGVVETAMRSTGARLLVIDPLLAHIPTHIDGYKDQHVRVALAPLAHMAEALDVAVVGVMHLNKREASDLFSRVGGSGGFVAAARSALLVAPDPADDKIRVVAHGKANMSEQAPSIAFRVEGREISANGSEPVKTSGIAWLGEHDASISDLLAGPQRQARGGAIEWLAQLLAAGPFPVEWIRSGAEEAGHSWATVRRAKEDLAVVAERVGGLAGSGRWEWRLPKGPTTKAPSGKSEHLRADQQEHTASEPKVLTFPAGTDSEGGSS